MDPTHPQIVPVSEGLQCVTSKTLHFFRSNRMVAAISRRMMRQCGRLKDLEMRVGRRASRVQALKSGSDKTSTNHEVQLRTKHLRFT